MASAVLADRNGCNWIQPRGGGGSGGGVLGGGGRGGRVLMGNVPFSKPNPSYNKRKFHGETNGFPMDESPAVTQSASDDASSINHRLKFSNPIEYNVYETFNITSYTGKELMDLEHRLTRELEQVRQMKNRLKSSDFHQRPTHPKKSSKMSGNKRPLSSSNIGQDSKRSNSELGNIMKSCSQILTKLMKHKHGWIFNKPVDVIGMGLHDYYDIIKRPMDLGSVKSKLSKNLYASLMDFAADVKLIFNNAMAYNPRGHDVYMMAEILLARFEELFRPFSITLEEERNLEDEGNEDQVYDEELQASSWNHLGTESTEREPNQSSRKSDRSKGPASTSNLPQPPLVQSPVRTPSPVRVPPVKPLKQPKPKAKDPNKREMSLEEKHKLGIGLQSLPPEKMEQVVHIINKRNGHLKQEGDEIELDIEAVDTETLWELDRLVTNWKKMVSKIKRQALLSSNTNASSALLSNNTNASSNKTNGAFPVIERMEVASDAKKPRKGETGEEDVDIGDEMPMSTFPPVEIEKDAGVHANSSSSSSSSSSSEDSSSSSDSDSEGSSSGSDSDDNKAQS